ncbi:MAG: RHS repeat-associated core domain-containing protein, partial [Cyanobacteria bacterium P01_C01_bin.147]
MVIGTTPADGTSFTDNTSAEGTTYYYQVRAVNATAVSAYSRIVKIEVPFSEPEPVEITRAFTHTPLFTGNISAIRWRNANDTIDQLYSFQYDRLNRLTSTQYAAYQDGTYQQEGVFAVPRYSYDLNGNVTSILRQGKNLNGAVDVIDDLSFHYGAGSNQGNQLRSVTDERGRAGFEDGTTSGDDYAYDANGNLLFDRNKGIDTIYYNHLNLPSAVVLSLSGGKEKDSLAYLYDAGGTKLQQKHYKADTLYKTTDYLGSRIYETPGASGQRTLVEIAHPEGRIVPVRAGESQAITSFDYQYHITDHLGNVRVTFSTTPERYEMVEDFENGAVNGFTDLKDHTDENANTTEPYDACNKASKLEIGETSAMLFLHVDKNDTIRAQVNASYTHGATGNTFLPIAYDALFGSYNGNIAYGEAGGAVENEFNEALRGAGMAGKDDGPDVPRAFINFIFFDKAMRYQRAGFTQISTAAYQTAPHQHETVALEAFVPDREGYILLYLSNENDQPVTVFFDDFVVRQRKTNVVFSSDYYPYGLSYHRFERTAQELRNKYGYQGKESLDEEGLDTYDFHARYYDPALGRFTTVDPKASQFATMSPYLGMGANPNMYVDPDGQELTVFAAIAIGAAISAGTYTASVGFSDGGFSNWDWGQFALGVGIGGLSGAASFGIGEAFQAAYGSKLTLGQSVLKAGIHGHVQGT